MPQNSFHYPMHAHSEMEIFYYISGKGSYLVEGTTYPLAPKDVLIMRRAETHKPQIDTSEPYDRIALHFSPELVNGFDPRLLNAFNDRLLGVGNKYSGTEHPRLCAAFENFDFSNSSFVKMHIIARLFLFLSELADISLPEDKLLFTNDYSSNLVGFVNDNLFNELSVDIISRHFSKSNAQITRDFKKATGSTLWEYVKVKRLLAAQEMIRRGEPAAAVCEACGYSDYSAFFRAYKAHFGKSPSQSR